MLACDNEKKLTDEQIKTRLLFVLSNIIETCKKNNLRYYVYAGTLLGVVRHNGFIPWDDDIDICMPRPDYDRLYDALSDNPMVTAYNCEKERDYIHTFMKVADNSTVISMPNSKDDGKMGVCIDVFPLDALGEDLAAARHMMNRYKFKRGIATMANLSSFSKGRSNNLLIKCARISAFVLSRLMKSNKLHVQLNQDARKNDYDLYEYVGSLIDATYREKEIYLREWFGSGVDAKFEDLTVKIPSKSHEILSQLYGEYMKLPPKEKQVSIHEYSAYYV